MLLECIRFEEYAGRDQEWVLDGLTLGPCNLLVGMNATGKSRSLNVIGTLAKLLSAQKPPTLSSADYNVCFREGEDRLRYSFRAEDEKVIAEQFAVNGKVYLDRGQGGKGEIFANEIGRSIKFQAPQNELAAVVRRDAIQHPFLQPLYDWGASVRHYHFGSSLGKDQFAILLPTGGAKSIAEADDRNAAEVVGVYARAVKEFGEGVFRDAILADLERVGYSAEGMGIGPPVSLRVEPQPAGKMVCLWVKEKGLRAVTDQFVMSQGMFRVVSILTLVNYLVLAKKACCLLLDDIGEGLDFERSCLLIDVLREKAQKSAIQLIAATNDKFVMNRVPLDEWSVLQRRGSHLKVLNQENSRELFEDFRFTGLSNFSFLELGFGNEVTEGAAAHG